MKSSSLVTALLATVFILGCDANSSTPGTAPSVRPVLSAIATPEAAKSEVFAGTIQARMSSPLAFSVPGRVASRGVSMGDRVSKGKLLASLDAMPFDLAVQSARANLANAEAQRVTATASEGRINELFRQKNVSTAQLEMAQQAREVADAAVAQAQAMLDIALDQRARTELSADFAGVVTAIPVEIGQTIAAGQSVVTLAASNQLEAVIDVPEDIAKTLPPNAEFEVTSQTTSSSTSGKVREISPRLDTLTKSRRIRIALDAPPSSMRLGSTIVAKAANAAPAMVWLPESAVRKKDGDTSVWVVDVEALTVSARAVKISGRRNGLVAVASGIAPGTRVVTAGVNSLSEGQPVKINSEAP